MPLASDPTGTTGTPGRDRDVARGVLAAHLVHHVGGRADEDQPGVGDRAGEGGALGEEAVAGVDRVGAGRAGGLEERGVEVGLGSGVGPMRTATSAARTCGASRSASE